MENKEIEIPEWFATETFNRSKAYKDKCKVDRDSGLLSDYDFASGAEWAFRRLSQQRGEGGWISVEDRLPEKFRNVLCYSNKGQIAISCVDASGELDTFHLEAENCAEWYTHWQPLPSPPSHI